MALVLNEDQQMLKDSAKNFCQQSSPLSVLRKLRDTNDEIGFDTQIWQQMLSLGWAGIAVPEAYGGFNFGYSGLGVVLEESGRTLASSPLIPSVLIGATAINEIGSESQKLELLPKIIAGELLLALAVDEHATHSPSNITTTATKTDKTYLIQGKKTFVLDGHVADKLIVVTRTAGGTDKEAGITLFLVDSDSPGLEIKRTLMVDNRNSAQVHFDDVKVPSEAMLGEEGNGFIALDRVLDIARIGIAAEMLGSIQELFDRIIDYLKQREQFGVLIGSFQGLQHRAATL